MRHAMPCVLPSPRRHGGMVCLRIADASCADLRAVHSFGTDP